jgi:flagellar hook protein FlgE
MVTSVTANADTDKKLVSALNNCNLTNGEFDVTVSGGTGSGTLHKVNVNVTSTTKVSDLVNSIQSQIGAASTSGITVGCSNGKITFTCDNTIATGLTFANPSDASVKTSNFLKETGLATAKIDPTTHGYSSNILDYKVNVTQVTSISDAVTISSYSIGDDGSIVATYNNGDSLTVKAGADGNTYGFKYTTAEGVVITGDDCNVDSNVAVPSNFVIQIASVTNEDGLLSAGNNLFTAGPNAGDILYSVGNAMGLGNVASGGYEASNVDLSSEFSGMILAQRAVQANSRVFSTTSDIMNEIVQMGR